MARDFLGGPGVKTAASTSEGSDSVPGGGS